MRISSIDVGLDYGSMVMLTCKLLLATAKAIVDIGPDMPSGPGIILVWLLLYLPHLPGL